MAGVRGASDATAGAVAGRLTGAEPAPAAGFARRMTCFVYEGVLLFGVLMTAGLLYAAATGQRNAMVGRHGLQAFLFFVLGVYFSWFWTRGGQTLAMKTWRIRLVCADGAPLSMARAWARYVLCWLWFAPALVWLWLEGASGVGPSIATLVAGVLVYAALARLNRERQFWHDVVCHTRLIDIRPRPTAPPHE